jgi:hypothetical protein
MTQPVLGRQPDKRFRGRLSQVKRYPLGKAVIVANNEAELFFRQDDRFQAIAFGWHRCDDHDV